MTSTTRRFFSAFSAQKHTARLAPTLVVFTGSGCTLCGPATHIARRAAARARCPFVNIDLGGVLGEENTIFEGGEHGKATAGTTAAGATGFEAWRQAFRNEVPVIALFKTEAEHALLGQPPPGTDPVEILYTPMFRDGEVRKPDEREMVEAIAAVQQGTAVADAEPG